MRLFLSDMSADVVAFQDCDRGLRLTGVFVGAFSSPLFSCWVWALFRGVPEKGMECCWKVLYESGGMSVEWLRLTIPRRTSFGAGFSRSFGERRSRMSFRSDALPERGGSVGGS